MNEFFMTTKHRLMIPSHSAFQHTCSIACKVPKGLLGIYEQFEAHQNLVGIGSEDTYMLIMFSDAILKWLALGSMSPEGTL